MTTNINPSPLPDPLMSPEEVSAYLGVSINTVYYWRTTYQGPPAFRVGRRTRYRLSDVDAWLESQRLGA